MKFIWLTNLTCELYDETSQKWLVAAILIYDSDITKGI